MNYASYLLADQTSESTQHEQIILPRCTAKQINLWWTWTIRITMDCMTKETLYGATSATQKIYQNFLVNIEDMDVAETEVDDDFLGDEFNSQ